MESELGLTSTTALDGLVDGLGPDPLYLWPGGRRFLLAASLIAGLHRGARVLDVGCGFGPAAVDLAEAFLCRVTAFDDHEPYLEVGRSTAAARGVGGLVTVRHIVGRDALPEFRHGAFDLVLGLGGSLTRTIPGGLIAGMAASAAWLSIGGILICGDAIAAARPSELIETIYGDRLLTEDAYRATLDEYGFDLIFASRATGGDWNELTRAEARLREQGLALRTTDNPDRAAIEAAANLHPEVAYLNVVARRRAE